MPLTAPGAGVGGGTTLTPEALNSLFPFVGLWGGAVVYDLLTTSDQDLIASPSPLAFQNSTDQLADASIDSANNWLSMTIGSDADDDKLLGANDDVAAADAPAILYVPIPESPIPGDWAVLVHRQLPDIATMSNAELSTLVVWDANDTDDFIRVTVGEGGSGAEMSASTTVAGSSGTIATGVALTDPEAVTGAWQLLVCRHDPADNTRRVSVFYAKADESSEPSAGGWTAVPSFQNVAWIADDGPLSLRCGLSVDSTVATPTGFEARITTWKLILPRQTAAT